ncbi:hypothetical protein ACVDFE_21090 [Lentzea chajnantorensis]
MMIAGAAATPAGSSRSTVRPCSTAGSTVNGARRASGSGRLSRHVQRSRATRSTYGLPTYALTEITAEPPVVTTAPSGRTSRRTVRAKSVRVSEVGVNHRTSSVSSGHTTNPGAWSNGGRSTISCSTSW